MRLCMSVIVLCGFLLSCDGLSPNAPLKTAPPLRLSERIGNFSIELLYRTTYAQEKRSNLIISPITIWSVLAVIAEGAADNTLNEIRIAARLSRNKEAMKSQFQNAEKFLVVNTTTVELQKMNALFVDYVKRPREEFIETAKSYETRVIPVDFSNSERTANLINTVISNVTHGHIPQIITSQDLAEGTMLLTSALYFKGQWTIPFNASSTMRESFYDSHGKKIGEVNMMYSRYTYPYAIIKELNAKVLELPYGTQNRLSMLIMLPNAGVSLEEMFLSFANVTLDTVFNELKIAQEQYSEDEVDCLIPRFKIDTSLTMNDVLRSMGIHDLFDETKASLTYISYQKMHVSKVIHKAQIEVTEEGTVAAAVAGSEFSNRIGVMRFEVNRPFCFLIVEKITNSIAFGGFYHTPSLY